MQEQQLQSPAKESFLRKVQSMDCIRISTTPRSKVFAADPASCTPSTQANGSRRKDGISFEIKLYQNALMNERHVAAMDRQSDGFPQRSKASKFSRTATMQCRNEAASEISRDSYSRLMDSSRRKQETRNDGLDLLSFSNQQAMDADRQLLQEKDEADRKPSFVTRGYFSLFVLLFGVVLNKASGLAWSESGTASDSKLAPAALQSVTEFLGPILPFTGGLDLRRDDLNVWDVWDLILPEKLSASWQNSWVHSAAATSTADRIARGGAEAAVPSLENRSKRIAKELKRDVILSSSSLFVPLTDIEEMSLVDVTHIFSYAMHANRPSFKRQEFVSSFSVTTNRILDAVDEAVAASRGPGVDYANLADVGTETSSLSEQGFGDIDALMFCAAMRIFAEWRLVRQVPEGYKPYAVGMSLGYKDVVQNLVKVEQASFAWIEERRELNRLVGQESQLHTPTLKDLLQEEIDLDVHGGKLPNLKEKSAAMGLLWVRRQLHYQVAIFANVNSGEHATARDAVAAAYSEVYNAYHGWAVQKIFGYSFQGAPPMDDILKVMNREAYQDLLNEVAEVPEMGGLESEVTTSMLRQEEENLEGSDDGNPLDRFLRHIGSECDKLGGHIGSEWDKLVRSVEGIFRKEGTSPDSVVNATGNIAGGAASNGAGLSEEEVRDRLFERSQKQFSIHLEVAYPLLNDLAGLFEEMNMNDPNKV